MRNSVPLLDCVTQPLAVPPSSMAIRARHVAGATSWLSIKKTSSPRLSSPTLRYLGFRVLMMWLMSEEEMVSAKHEQ